MSTSTPPIVQLQNISKHYQSGEETVRALDQVSLEIKKGEFLSILGPSGSGKSTLMNVIGCLDKPTSGDYQLDNEDVSVMTSKQLAMIRNRNIGFVFQGIQFAGIC